ncbi:MAG: type VI secretion system contractile sheath domain-containing protein [Bilophila wadsworthia]
MPALSATTDPVETFVYEEDVAGRPRPLPLGQRGFRPCRVHHGGFAKYGWTAAIRGYEGGGAVKPQRLQVPPDQRRDGGAVPHRGEITDRRERTFGSRSSLIYAEFGQAAFFSGQTVHKPPVYTSDGNANADLGAAALSAERIAVRALCQGEHAGQGGVVHDGG